MWAIRHRFAARCFRRFCWSSASLAFRPPPSSAAEPLTISSLTADRAFPVIIETAVTWTASVTGGAFPYTYKFLVFDGSAWTVGRDWNASNTWTWYPQLPGDYVIQVWVRNAASSSPFDAWFGQPATINVPPVASNGPKVSSVSSSVASVPAGSPITWTATAEGGYAPYGYTYAWDVYNGARGGWDIGQWPSRSNTWTWIPPAAGTYWFRVWAGDAYMPVWYSGSTTRVFGPITFGVPEALAVTSLTPSLLLPIVGVAPGYPVPARTPVTWTATALGSVAPYSYKFYVFDGTSWSLGQDWSASNTWTWIPPDSGYYTVQVWARNEGSSTVDAWRSVGPVIIEANHGLELNTRLSPSDRVFPVHPAGTPVTWRLTAMGGAGPYTFKFYVWDGSGWTLGQDWSAADTFTWVPSAPGSYWLQVWARNAGSMTEFDAWGQTDVSVGSAVPLAVTRFTMSPMSPLVVNGPATFGATVIGGTGPYTYQFWVYDGTSWSLGRDWDAASSFTWVPPANGTYSFQVWVRNAGSMTAFDTWASLGPVTVVP
jgi:hypothetical protein